MELDYTKVTENEFDAVVDNVEKSAAAKGFRVLHIHDVKATLEDKGFERDSMKIVEICNARFAHRALGFDEKVGLFMPCKINIYKKSGKTVVSAARPTLIGEFLPRPELIEMAEEVDTILRSIVDEVC